MDALLQPALLNSAHYPFAHLVQQMVFETIFKKLSTGYHLKARLRGHVGAINCLAFTRDGKYLASGGDDEVLQIWDTEAKAIRQVLSDKLERWGQVTCVRWLSGNSDGGNVLSFATGRGLVLIYQRSKDSEIFRELSNTNVFPFNEPVEAMDYDRAKCRLIVSSHTGKINMFSVEKNGSLALLWQKDLNDTKDWKAVIPRAIKFTGKGEHITIFGLESGIMTSKVAATGIDVWSKTLKSSIGGVSASADNELLLVDNLAKGFDLYQYPRTSPLDSFNIPRENAFIHEAVFLENANSIACGSDHGKIYLFSLETTKCTQKLSHGTPRSTIQILDACTSNSRHMIASGSNENRPCIHIWEKKITKGYTPQIDRSQDRFTIMSLLNFFMMVAVVGLWLGGELCGDNAKGWLNPVPVSPVTQLIIDGGYNDFREMGYRIDENTFRKMGRRIDETLRKAELLRQRMESNDKKYGLE